MQRVFEVWGIISNNNPDDPFDCELELRTSSFEVAKKRWETMKLTDDKPGAELFTAMLLGGDMTYNSDRLAIRWSVDDGGPDDIQWDEDPADYID